MSIIMLYLTSFTDPGILPSPFMNSGISRLSLEKKSAEPNRDYYVEYQDKQQL